MWESIKICFIIWKTTSETHETLKSVYRSEAVSHTCVLNCSQDSEGDMTIWKLIQGVCIHQLLNIQKELQRLVNAGQRLLNALKVMKDQLRVNWETHSSWYLAWRNMWMMFYSQSYGQANWAQNHNLWSLLRCGGDQPSVLFTWPHGSQLFCLTM